MIAVLRNSRGLSVFRGGRVYSLGILGVERCTGWSPCLATGRERFRPPPTWQEEGRGRCGGVPMSPAPAHVWGFPACCCHLAILCRECSPWCASPLGGEHSLAHVGQLHRRHLVRGAQGGRQRKAKGALVMAGSRLPKPTTPKSNVDV